MKMCTLLYYWANKMMMNSTENELFFQSLTKAQKQLTAQLFSQSVMYF